MPRKNTILKRQAREMVHDVYAFLKSETIVVVGALKEIKNEIEEATNKLLSHSGSTTKVLKRINKTAQRIKKRNMKLDSVIRELRKVQKRTAEATKTSIATVRNINTQATNPALIAKYTTPGKRGPRTKPITNITDHDREVIKSCIQNFYKTNNEHLTIAKLKSKLEQEINFKGSERSLGRIIKDLGFRWKTTEKNRKVLIEASEPDPVSSQMPSTDQTNYNLMEGALSGADVFFY